MNMTVEVKNKGPAVGYLDPECLCSTMLNNTDNTLALSVFYMLNAFNLYATKDLILTAYLSTNHWIVVAIIPKQWKVYYLDSLKKINTNTGPFEVIINE
jgi:predicted aminopeptidase